MEYEKVTETIIGCAYRVYNKMGFGFLESVYEKRKVKDLNLAINRIKKTNQVNPVILSKIAELFPFSFILLNPQPYPAVFSQTL